MSGPRGSFHRKPPLPPQRGRGWCRWCGTAILHPDLHARAGEPNLRRTWHPDCIAIYRIACGWPDQRKAIYRRDRGRCAVCGRRGRKIARGWYRSARVSRRKETGALYCAVAPILRRDWHVDHIVPLWQVPRDLSLVERDRYWGLSNLQTLCEEHHHEKTARESAERAALRHTAQCDAPASRLSSKT